MNGILLKNVVLNDVLSDILISDGKFSRICAAGTISDVEGCETVDCGGKTVIPSFINMHTHASMVMMRSVAEDMVFDQWIQSVWKLEKRLCPEFVYWSSKVAAIELIKTGTTVINDQYFITPETAKAFQEMGIRLCSGHNAMDFLDKNLTQKEKDATIKEYEEYKAVSNDLTTYVTNIHSVYTVSEELLLWSVEYARKNGHLMHIHLSETRNEVEQCKEAHGGLTPVEYFDSIGLLGPEVIAAHTLWLTPKDIEILAKRGVTCVHNINSNTKLCSGYKFPYNELRDAGVNVCLGTDGCASSNNLDLLEAMKTSALFQKAWREDPTAMPLGELMDMATINGAKALRLNSGVIKEGANADLLIVDTDNTFFLSPAPFLANLVYSAHSDCVDSVICNGKFVMRGRVVPGEKEILKEARKALSILTK